MKDLLLNPNEFFKGRADTEPRLMIPFLIILISGILGGIQAFFMVGLMAESMPEEIAQFMGLGQIMGAVGAIVVSIVLWVVFAAIFFGLSGVFKGTGRFKKVLEITGYGYLPMLFGAVITLTAFSVILPSIPIPEIDFSDLEQVQTAGTIIQSALNNNSYFLISWVVGMLLVLWAANLWVFGLYHARKIELKHAFISVVIPVAAYIIYSVVSIGGF